MRIGVVGIGRIGTAHAKVLMKHPNVSSVVVSDMDASKASAVAGHLGCEVAGSVADLLALNLDGLLIASTTDSHADLIVAGARAGLAVFCEKPIALGLDETRKVVEQVRDAGVQVQIGFQRRFDRGYAQARVVVQSAELGELHRVHMVTCDPAPPHASYIASSGGIFRDCHIHDFDILRWVTGREVVEVFALGANRGSEVFRESGDVDSSAAVLRLDGGALVTLQGSRYNGAGYDVRMEVAGDLATHAVGLSSRTPVRSTEPGTDFPDGRPWPGFWERFEDAYVAEMDAFVRVIDGSSASPCTPEDALRALEIAHAADRSRREGRPVALKGEVVG